MKCRQFGLRVFFVSVLFVGIGATWLGGESLRLRQQRNAIESLESNGGSCHFDYEFNQDGVLISGAKPRSNWAIRALLGSDACAYVVSVDVRQVDHVFVLKEFPRLRYVHGLNLAMTDELLIEVSENACLERVVLPGHHAVSDNGLASLKKLQRLRCLLLGEAKVSNKGLEHVSAIKSLESFGAAIRFLNRDGLGHLADLPNLTTLHIGTSDISEEDMRAFLSARPEVRVLRTEPRPPHSRFPSR